MTSSGIVTVVVLVAVIAGPMLLVVLRSIVRRRSQTSRLTADVADNEARRRDADLAAEHPGEHVRRTMNKRF